MAYPQVIKRTGSYGVVQLPQVRGQEGPGGGQEGCQGGIQEMPQEEGPRSGFMKDWTHERTQEARGPQ